MEKITSVIHCGGTDVKKQINPLVPPIYQTTTFKFESVEQGRDAFSGGGKTDAYTRLSNETHRQLEEQLMIMHGAETAQVFASGMGGIASLFFSVLKTGSYVIAHKILYGCTYNLLKEYEKFGVKVNFIDATDFDEIEDVCVKSVSYYNKSAVFYLESLANPTLDCPDIEKISLWLKKHFSKALLVVDNTFATPYNLRPLEWGADVVVESLSKYINGMGNVLGGVLLSRKKHEYAWEDYSLIGGLLDPEVASKISNNLKTLGPRMEIHNKNAMAIARLLENHPKVEKVYYPGLPSHPQYDIAKKLLFPGFSGMISFELKGNPIYTEKFLNEMAYLYGQKMSCIALGVSLGTIYSLIESPAQMTHYGISPEERKKIGIPEKLIRFSVGIEDIIDIKISLGRALECVCV